MGYISVAETAKKWSISERSVRNYCAAGRVPGAFLTGKTWNIPEDAEKPGRVSKKRAPATLLEILKDEKASKRTGGIRCLLPVHSQKVRHCNRFFLDFFSHVQKHLTGAGN